MVFIYLDTSYLVMFCIIRSTELSTNAANGILTNMSQSSRGRISTSETNTVMVSLFGKV